MFSLPDCKGLQPCLEHNWYSINAGHIASIKLHEAQRMWISLYFNLYRVAIQLSHGNDSLYKTNKKI